MKTPPHDDTLHALLHPITLSAIGLQFLNDHVFRRMAPSPFWGKLGDVTMLIYAPLLFAALLAVFSAGARSPHPADRRSGGSWDRRSVVYARQNGPDRAGRHKHAGVLDHGPPVTVDPRPHRPGCLARAGRGLVDLATPVVRVTRCWETLWDRSTDPGLVGHRRDLTTNCRGGHCVHLRRPGSCDRFLGMLSATPAAIKARMAGNIGCLSSRMIPP